jgi:hypothetical protein
MALSQLSRLREKLEMAGFGLAAFVLSYTWTLLVAWISIELAVVIQSLSLIVFLWERRFSKDRLFFVSLALAGALAAIFTSHSIL